MSLPPALPRRFFELFTRHSPDTSGFTELHGVVASVKVPKGGSEIGTVCELLRLLPLDGATIIGHAAFTRASVARQIVKGGGDYYLTVKDNHRHLRCDLAMLFHPASPWRRQPGQTVERARSQDRGHGREETRRIETMPLPERYVAWPAASQACRITRQRRTPEGESVEIVYALTSIERGRQRQFAVPIAARASTSLTTAYPPASVVLFSPWRSATAYRNRQTVPSFKP